MTLTLVKPALAPTVQPCESKGTRQTISEPTDAHGFSPLSTAAAQQEIETEALAQFDAVAEFEQLFADVIMFERMLRTGGFSCS